MDSAEFSSHLQALRTLADHPSLNLPTGPGRIGEGICGSGFFRFSGAWVGVEFHAVIVDQQRQYRRLQLVPGQRVVSPVPHAWWCSSSHQGHIISPDKRATLSLVVRCQSSHTGHIRATQNLGTTSPVSVLAHGALRNVVKLSGLAEHPGNQLPDLPLLRLKDEGNSQLVLCAAVPPASILNSQCTYALHSGRGLIAASRCSVSPFGPSV